MGKEKGMLSSGLSRIIEEYGEMAYN